MASSKLCGRCWRRYRCRSSRCGQPRAIKDMASLLAPGVYPAAVTPMDGEQRVDEPSLAKLLAWFEAAGCRGAVLAGTNGEGPSLSATEKRELIACAAGMRGKLEL